MKSALLTAANIATFSGAFIGDPIAGQITVANASQFESANLSQALTSYVAGQPAPDLEKILDEMFPPVEAPGRFFEFQKHNDEFFITESDDSDIRPVNAAFKRIEYRGAKVAAKVTNKGLTFRQDHDGMMRDANGKLPSGWQKSVADNLRKRLIRAEILRGIALLDAASTNAAATWDAASNPDGGLRNACRLSLVAKGMRPTHLLIGDLAWMYRQDAYEAATRTNELANHAEYDEAELARYLGLSTVRREDSLYQTKKNAAITGPIGA